MNNEELFDKYLSDTLTDHEEGELHSLLKDDAIGQQLVEYSLEIFTNVKTADDLLKGNTSKEKSELLKQYQEPIPLFKYITVVISVAAMLVVGLWLSRPINVENTEISKVGEKANIVHGGKFRLGDTIKTSKPTHFEFMDGSKIKLFGEVVVQNEKLIYLKSGYIDVNAVPQENGKLIIKTDNAQAAVLGSSFTLRKVDDATALEISEGNVEFSHKGESKVLSRGFAAITYNGKIISSQKGLTHANHIIYSSMLTSDSSLKLYSPLENTDPLKVIGFPPKSCKLVSGSFVKGRNTFTRALKNGVLEMQNSESFDMKIPCSIGVWINISEFESYLPIFTKGNNAWRVQTNVNGKRFNIGFGDSGQFINSKKFVDLNKWYFLTFVSSEKSVMVYVDGELENEKPINSYNFKNDSTIMIGGNKTDPDRSFKGLIGNVFILQRALSASEVKRLYGKGK